MDGMKTKRVQLKQLLQEQLQKIQPGIMEVYTGVRKYCFKESI